MDEVIREMENSRKVPGVERIRVPGEQSHATWLERSATGVPMNETLSGICSAWRLIWESRVFVQQKQRMSVKSLRSASVSEVAAGRGLAAALIRLDSKKIGGCFLAHRQALQ